MSKKDGRRDFLNPIKAIRAFRDASQSSESPEPILVDDSTGNDYLLYVSKSAMACQFQVYFPPEMGEDVAESAIEALELVEELENQMTVYRPSPMTYLNEMAFQEPVRVESKLFGLLLKATELFHLTEGAFDMTSGQLTKSWGFFRKEETVPTQSEIAKALESVGTAKIILDRDEETVQFTVPNLEINLGGIGKGFALDRTADFLATQGVDHFLIHGGQSSVLARGYRTSNSQPMPVSEPNHPPEKEPLSQTDSMENHSSPTGIEPWRVGLQHPIRTDHRIAEICLSNKSLGTSGTGRQSFYHRGKRYGHISILVPEFRQKECIPPPPSRRQPPSPTHLPPLFMLWVPNEPSNSAAKIQNTPVL